MKSLSQRDQIIWHPYSRINPEGAANVFKPIPIVSGQGCWLTDDLGNRYLDAISSWWVNIHGHSHPYIADKVSKQLNTLEHVIFAGFTHIPAIELAERLLEILPENQSKIFYSDNGSTAVEVALKMSFQYWNNRSQSKPLIIAFKNAYHGDTFGAMSVSGRSDFNEGFSPFLFEVLYIDPPAEQNNSREQIQTLIDKHNNRIAAFIYEPLVQGTAGMQMHSPEGLNELLSICHKNEILCIADEVMTGFGTDEKVVCIRFHE